MKKSIFTLIVLSLFFSGNIFAQYVTAEDEAGNYTSWVNGNNNGFGFSAWDMWITGNAGFFIGSSSTQGFGDIDVDGKSFGMYGNTTLGDYSNAQRLFSNWSDGATFSIDLAVAFRNGNKGIDIFGSGYEIIWNFNVGGDNYTAGGVNQNWPYSQTSVFQLTATQNGNDVDILLTRGTDSYSTTITGKSLIGFKLYEGNTESGDLNNLYFNSLKVSYADPAKVPATANVTIDGDVTLGATQTLTVNNLSIPTGNSFTLESTASGTGSLIINGTCTDEINVQRFLTGGWDWHFLSSPVQNQKIVGAENFIEFPGGVGDPNVDFYKYNETETSGSPWINIKNDGEGTLNTNFGSPSGDPEFEDPMGYLVAYNDGDITKTFTGLPYTGIQGNILSYTEAGSQGWNLVGNRFQSAIDWESGTNLKDALDNGFYYVYNQDLHGGSGGFEYFYSSVLPEGNTDNVNGKIPAMQAFFVKAKVGGGLFSLSPMARVHNNQQFLKEESDNNNLLKLQIQGNQYTNETKVVINNLSTIGADYEDASMLFSLSNAVPHIYSYVENEKLVVNNVPFPDDDYSLPLGIKVGNAGTYTITTIDIENFNSSILPVLEDTEAGMEIDLRFNDSYTFEVTEPGINNSRFILHMKTAIGVDELYRKPELAVSQIGNELRFYNLELCDYQIRLLDVTGRILLNEKTNGQNAIVLPASLNPGAYILHLSGEKAQWTQKVALK